MRILLTALAVILLAPDCNAKIFGRRKARRESEHMAQHEPQTTTTYHEAPMAATQCTGPNCPSPAYQQQAYYPTMRYAAPLQAAAPVEPPPAAPVAEPPPAKVVAIEPPAETPKVPVEPQTINIYELPLIRVTIVDRDGGPDREAVIDLADFTKIVIANH